MFNSLTGIITGKFPQKLFIDTHGIEWDVTVPDSALDKLPPVGQEGKVYVWMQHTDVLMTLFGFATLQDRELFFDLLKVDGIGPKGAIKILGNVTSKDLNAILESGDIDSLQKIPGVGKKTAGKMLLQLKGKLKLTEDDVVVSRKENVPFAAVVTALVSMGYDRKNAEAAVARVNEGLKKDEAFASKSSSDREDAVFRLAIMELAQ